MSPTRYPAVLTGLQLPTSSTSRRGGYSYGFDLRLDPIRLDHLRALKRLSTEELGLEESQQTVDPTGKDVGNCKPVDAQERGGGHGLPWRGLPGRIRREPGCTRPRGGTPLRRPQAVPLRLRGGARDAHASGRRGVRVAVVPAGDQGVPAVLPRLPRPLRRPQDARGARARGLPGHAPRRAAERVLGPLDETLWPPDADGASRDESGDDG